MNKIIILTFFLFLISCLVNKKHEELIFNVENEKNLFCDYNSDGSEFFYKFYIDSLKTKQTKNFIFYKKQNYMYFNFDTSMYVNKEKLTKVSKDDYEKWFLHYSESLKIFPFNKKSLFVDSIFFIPRDLFFYEYFQCESKIIPFYFKCKLLKINIQYNSDLKDTIFIFKYSNQDSMKMIINDPIMPELYLFWSKKSGFVGSGYKYLFGCKKKDIPYKFKIKLSRFESYNLIDDYKDFLK